MIIWCSKQHACWFQCLTDLVAGCQRVVLQTLLLSCVQHMFQLGTVFPHLERHSLPGMVTRCSHILHMRSLLLDSAAQRQNIMSGETLCSDQLVTRCSSPVPLKSEIFQVAKQEGQQQASAVLCLLLLSATAHARQFLSMSLLGIAPTWPLSPQRNLLCQQQTLPDTPDQLPGCLVPAC